MNLSLAEEIYAAPSSHFFTPQSGYKRELNRWKFFLVIVVQLSHLL